MGCVAQWQSAVLIKQWPVVRSHPHPCIDNFFSRFFITNCSAIFLHLIPEPVRRACQKSQNSCMYKWPF